MTLKTLKDIKENVAYCITGVKGIKEGATEAFYFEARQQAIKYIKQKYWAYCQCGLKLTHHYEGEAICPEFEKLVHLSDKFPSDEEFEKIREKHNWLGHSATIDVADFIFEFFNLTEEDLK